MQQLVAMGTNRDVQKPIVTPKSSKYGFGTRVEEELLFAKTPLTFAG
jgi:hypothetical protein